MAVKTRNDSTLSLGVTVGANTTFTVIPGVKSMTLPSSERELVDITSFSTVGINREYVLGLGDTNDVTIPMYYNPQSPIDISFAALQASGDVMQLKWIITGAVGANSTFTTTWSGLVTKYETNIEDSGAVGEAIATVKILTKIS